MPSGRRHVQMAKSSSSSTGQQVLEVNGDGNSNGGLLNDYSLTTEKPISEVTIVAAMQDHISCTKLKSSVNNGNSIATNDVTKMTFELDHMYANCSSSGQLHRMSAASLSPSSASVDDQRAGCDDDSQQIPCLKELLILHLELVGQEQEKSLLKDMEIAALKKENESLKQQLKELEKFRLKREHKESSSRSRVGGRGIGVNESDSESSSSQWRESRTRSRRIIGEKRKSSSRDGGHSDEHTQEHNKQKRKSGGLLQEKINGLWTDILYYTPVGEVTGEDSDLEACTSNVQVPGWRVKVVTSCYQMEKTENLDDDIFLKRHQKLEIEEKRRKRWDIQRVREQRIQEKLKLGRQARKKTSPVKAPLVQTFYPSLDDVQMLEVCDELPVTAFGVHIVKEESSEFSIPWLTG
ncbi:male-specific lethal 1 [Chamberlinius hualienensis]